MICHQDITDILTFIISNVRQKPVKTTVTGTKYIESGKIDGRFWTFKQMIQNLYGFIIAKGLNSFLNLVFKRNATTKRNSNQEPDHQIFL